MNHSILGSKGMYNHLSQPPSLYSDTFQSQRFSGNGQEWL